MMLLLSAGVNSVVDAQRQFGGGVSVGYAAGLDAPVLADGSLSVRGAIWMARREGLEFGLAVGRNQFEDRTTVTSNLYRNPSTGGIGTAPCTGCVAGDFEQRSREDDGYVTPTITLRAPSRLLVQPYATLGVGLYLMRSRTDSRFLATADGSASGSSNNVTRHRTGGGSLTLGLQMPVNSRLRLDLSSQLQGAALVGNDYAGGRGYAVFAAGVAIR